VKEEAWEQGLKKDSWVIVNNHNEDNSIIEEIPRKEEKSTLRL